MARAGDIIYLARRRGNISQTELAKRSGVAQGVISSYEHHKVQPSYETVEHLVGCCRLRLNVTFEELTEVEMAFNEWLLGLSIRLPMIKDSAAEHGLHELWLAPEAERHGPLRLLAWSPAIEAVSGFERYIAGIAVPKFEVLDAERLPPAQWRPVARAALPLQFGSSWRRNETRFTDLPMPADTRWYGSVISGMAPDELLGKRRFAFLHPRQGRPYR